jgi:hypothetical protein
MKTDLSRNLAATIRWPRFGRFLLLCWLELAPNRGQSCGIGRRDRDNPTSSSGYLLAKIGCLLVLRN